MPGWAPHTYGHFSPHHSVPIPTALSSSLPPAGLQDGVYEASRDISVAKGVQLEASRYFTYLHPDPSSMPEIRSVSACATGPLASVALRCPRFGWLFPMQGLGHWGLVATSRIPVGLVGNSTSSREPAGTGERSHGVDSAMGREIPLQLLHRAISRQPWQGLGTEQLCSPDPCTTSLLAQEPSLPTVCSDLGSSHRCRLLLPPVGARSASAPGLAPTPHLP